MHTVSELSFPCFLHSDKFMHATTFWISWCTGNAFNPNKSNCQKSPTFHHLLFTSSPLAMCLVFEKLGRHVGFNIQKRITLWVLYCYLIDQFCSNKQQSSPRDLMLYRCMEILEALMDRKGRYGYNRCFLGELRNKCARLIFSDKKINSLCLTLEIVLDL